MRFGRVDQDFDQQFAWLQHSTSGRGAEVLDLDLRSPLGPTTRAFAPSAISAGVVSAAGEPLHRLPPTEARLWIWFDR